MASRQPPTLDTSRWETIHRIVWAGIHRVKRAQDQVPRLISLQSQLDGLVIAHLADQNHLGRLAQRRAQPVGERVDIAPQLALVEGRLDSGMHELERDDVDRLGFISISRRSAASDVDLPVPVPPVTRIMPFFSLGIS